MVLLLQVEPQPSLPGEQLGNFKSSCSEAVHKTTALRATIEIVAAGTFPRTDFKARRVIDDRDVFRELHRKLQR